jgi:hypothetical protein
MVDKTNTGFSGNNPSLLGRGFKSVLEKLRQNTVPESPNTYSGLSTLSTPLVSSAAGPLRLGVERLNESTPYGSPSSSQIRTALRPVPDGGFIPARPIPKTVAEGVNESTKSALTVGSVNGNQMGKANRQAQQAQTLMGGDLPSFVGNLLRMFAQPEFQQAGFEGQGFGPTVLGATNALRAMDTQDAATQAANLEALGSIEAAGPIWGDAKSFQVEKFDSLQRTIKSADTIQNMKKLLSEGFVSGGFPEAVGLLRGLGNLVNISLKPSNLEEYTTQTNQLATDLVASGIFGKEVNKSEWKLIFELIAKPGATKGPPELIEKLNSLLLRINNNIQSDSRVLEAMGVPLDELLAPSEPLFRRGN